MIEELMGIKIKGKCFKDETATELELFKQPKRVCIIFGKNGSGKTTVSEAIMDKISNSDEDGEKEKCEVDFYDEQGNLLDYENESNCIHIYNEEFVDKKVKYVDTGLDSIAMFGEQIKIDQQIKEVDLKLEQIAKEITNKDELIHNLKTGEVGYEHKFSALKKQLQMPRQWAKRDSQIREKIVAASVTQMNIASIFKMIDEKVETDLSQLYNLFEDKLDDYLLAKSNKSHERKKIKIVYPNSRKIKESINLLKTIVPKPIDKAQFSWIFDELEKRGNSFYNDVKEVMENPNSNKCPFCMQDLNDQVKNDVIRTLEIIQDNKSKNFVEKISNSILESNNFKIPLVDEEEYNDISEIGKEVSLINAKIQLFNNLVEDLIKRQKIKMNNIYGRVEEIGFDKFADKVKEIKEIEKKINDTVTDYNSKLTNVGSMKNNLIKLNAQLVCLEHGKDYREYKDILEKYNSEVLNKRQLLKDEKENKNLRRDYNSQKLNVKVALEEINKSLEFVFFQEKRLYLELNEEDGTYIVKSRGERVRLKDLSMGERDAISLCYFFSRIFNQCDISKKFNQNRLIIIDDPISSLDYDNKIGIYSFLRKQLNDLLTSNFKNKLLIFSHDYGTFIQLKKLIEDIQEQYMKHTKKNRNQTKEFTPILKELNHFKLNELNTGNFDQMTRMVTELAEYAYGQSNGIFNDSISNNMRRILEGYGSFNYNMGITELANNEKILKKIKDERARDYFQNLMYRFVLHDESHFADTAHAFPDSNSITLIDPDEKQKVAKDILSFLFLLDPIFIECNIDDKNENYEHYLQCIDDNTKNKLASATNATA